MAHGQFGVSFQPGVTGGQARNGSGPQAPRNPAQEAIQMLSLRLPKVFGARAIAPAPLLTSPGGMGQSAARGNMSAQALASLAGVPSGSGMPSMPAPMIPTPPIRSAPSIPTLPRMPTFEPSPASPPVFGIPPQPGRPRPELAPLPDPFGPPPGRADVSSAPPSRGWQDWIPDERRLPSAPALPPTSLPPPRVVPGQETGEGPPQFFQPPAPWIDPRPELPLAPPRDPNREQLFDPPPPAFQPSDYSRELLTLLSGSPFSWGGYF